MGGDATAPWDRAGPGSPRGPACRLEGHGPEVPGTDSDTDMGSMDHGTDSTDSTVGPDSGAVMPGMATDQDLQQLDQAVGVDAETLYLRLMVAHHQGGVTMAQGALDRVQDQDVRRLAQAIVDSQTAELAVLEQMLAER